MEKTLFDENTSPLDKTQVFSIEDTLIKKPERLSPLRVLKFGGSSLKDSTCMNRVAEIVKNRILHRPIVVLSAIHTTTNQLLDLAYAAEQGIKTTIQPVFADHQSIGNALKIDITLNKDIMALVNEANTLLDTIYQNKLATEEQMDYIMSFGERLAVRLFAEVLNSKGVFCKAYDSWQVGMITTKGPGSARAHKTDLQILSSSMQNISNFLSPLKYNYTQTPIITGFIARDIEDHIVTLGRNGSDFSASVIAAAIEAEEVEIWTDVNGILSADPRIVPNSKSIDEITFEQASIMSMFGARILHPRAIEPAERKGIPIAVKNSFNPEHKGTRTVSKVRDIIPKFALAITCQENVTLIHAYCSNTRDLHFSSYIGKICNEYKIYSAVISISDSAASLTLDMDASKHVDALVKQLSNVADVECQTSRALLCVLCNPTHITEICAKTCQAVASIGAPMDMVVYGESNLYIAVVLSQLHIRNAMRAVHTALFTDPLN